MSLIIDGIEIPNTGDIIYDGVHLEKIICDGVEVWKKYVNLMESFENPNPSEIMQWSMETTDLQFGSAAIYSKDPIDLKGQIIKVNWTVSGIYPNQGISSDAWVFQKTGDSSTPIENLGNDRYRLPSSGRAYLGISINAYQKYTTAKPSQPGHSWIQTSTVYFNVQYD